MPLSCRAPGVDLAKQRGSWRVLLSYYDVKAWRIKLLHDKGRLLRWLTQNIDSWKVQQVAEVVTVATSSGMIDSAACIDEMLHP